MTRSRTPLEAAAGKLVAAIQREWDMELGEPEAAISFDAMDAAHHLPQAASKFGSLESVIGPGSTFAGSALRVLAIVSVHRSLNGVGL
ncbi:hypothetical protein [Variovorax sp. LjRoot84]|uniref:hypothetical protein n=1 Tax=Variovorax sp. LjRoot84 TaxID=3342340 RepID=UPI003F515E8B